MDYSEQEQDSESDTTYSESSGTVVEELPEFREALEELWTPVTLSNKISQVGEQYKRMTEQARETSMAHKSDLSGMEKMMQMFLQMKRDDQMREQKREEDRLERDERRLKDEQERELRREREDREREEKRVREDRDREDT